VWRATPAHPLSARRDRGGGGGGIDQVIVAPQAAPRQ